MSKKEAILKAATHFFSEKGFKDTSMSELARTTGVAQGTIFYHFKNKEELFLATLASIKERILEHFDRYLSEKTFQNGLDMVEGIVSFYLYLAGMMEDLFLLLQRHDPYQLAAENATCRRHLEAIYSCFVDMFERGVVRGQEDGSIGKMPARKTALIVFSMVDGLVRLNTYNLCDAGTLYNELIESCRRMLENDDACVV